MEDLREDHPSIPRNPLLAEVLYLARYIERAGSGTQAMIDECRRAGLQEPEFEQRRGSFVTTLWRNWLTEEVLARFNLNDRQRQAIAYLRTHGRISNTRYQQEMSAIKKTASRDLSDLKEKGLLKQVGTLGPGVHYVLAEKEDILRLPGA